MTISALLSWLEIPVLVISAGFWLKSALIAVPDVRDYGVASQTPEGIKPFTAALRKSAGYNKWAAGFAAAAAILQASALVFQKP